MADFHQEGLITTLHALYEAFDSEEYLVNLEKNEVIIGFQQQKPIDGMLLKYVVNKDKSVEFKEQVTAWYEKLRKK